MRPEAGATCPLLNQPSFPAVTQNLLPNRPLVESSKFPCLSVRTNVSSPATLTLASSTGPYSDITLPLMVRSWADISRARAEPGFPKKNTAKTPRIKKKPINKFIFFINIIILLKP